MSFTPTTPIAPFYGFTNFTPALPDFYWDVYSAEERIKEICYRIHKIVCYSNMLADNINIDHTLIDELQQAFEQFMESGFDDYYKAQVKAWIAANFQTIMDGLLGHMLFFALDKDGYFRAYIPEKWAIAFDTIMDYSDINYGSLCIKY